MNERIVNIETGEVIEQPVSKNRLEEIEIEREKAQAETEAAAAARAEAEAKRQALLAKLGITEDEAQLLLGGN